MTTEQQRPLRELWHEHQSTAKQHAVSYELFYDRVKRLGWSCEKAATTTPYTTKNNGIKIKALYKENAKTAKRNGVTYHTFYTRIKKGLTVEQALHPVKRNPKVGFTTDKNIYSYYCKGELVCTGTINQIAKRQGIKVSSLKFLLRPAYQQRLAEKPHLAKLVKATGAKEYDY